MSLAPQRYFQRHIEKGLPPPPAQCRGRWQHALVIPAYDESPTLLERLQTVRAAHGRVLVVLVLNRPDSQGNGQVNEAMRTAIAGLTTLREPAFANGYTLNPGADLLLFDHERNCGATPARQGVGLARKSGCDLVALWHRAGCITSDWLCSSDADAELPADYFERLAQAPGAATAAVFPFTHVARQVATHQPDETYHASALYELRLHHYVLGLEYAQSPYAFHTLGSALACRVLPYTQVRGFPRRAGGEDFYLLNKLAKVGEVTRLTGAPIALTARRSERVPFGTGPAVMRILQSPSPMALPLFYHPQGFRALAAVLKRAPGLPPDDSAGLAGPLQAELQDSSGLSGASDAALARDCAAVLVDMGLMDALAHCHRQASSPAQFLRHFHQWFDGFRTLKFLHGLRSRGWQDQSLQQLGEHSSGWPAAIGRHSDPAEQIQAVRDYWRWN